jgi:uncharacterized membrane protein YcgQ (UPF0703/DUF1980 family)
VSILKKIVIALLCLPLLAAAGYKLYAEGSLMSWTSEAYDIEPAPTWQELQAAAKDAPVPEIAAPKPRESTPALALAQGENPIEIRDKLFVQQCNDIYLNPNEYRGKSVKLEGMYGEYRDDENGELQRYVIRYGPGCCGNDGTPGFEFLYDGDASPKEGDWVEVIGVVDLIKGETDDYEYVVLASSSLTIMEKRGQEYVID